MDCPPIEIVVFNPDEGRMSRSLDRILSGGAVLDRAVVCRTIKELEKRLSRPEAREILVAAAAWTDRRLDQLLLLADRLERVRLILVIPDRTRAAVASALRLRPRFFTDAASDLNQVKTVLEKMFYSLSAAGTGGRSFSTTREAAPNHEAI